ncbi:MAG: hypothetical protein ACQERC_07950 [Bacteroidota bacterium]
MSKAEGKGESFKGFADILDTAVDLIDNDSNDDEGKKAFDEMSPGEGNSSTGHGGMPSSSLKEKEKTDSCTVCKKSGSQEELENDRIKHGNINKTK